eukprot:364297-Chlamydomonas_euryale.AAC.6
MRQGFSGQVGQVHQTSAASRRSERKLRCCCLTTTGRRCGGGQSLGARPCRNHAAHTRLLMLGCVARYDICITVGVTGSGPTWVCLLHRTTPVAINYNVSKHATALSLCMQQR